MASVEATAWTHTSIAVDDFDRAVRFYRDAFGFEVLFEDRGMTDVIRKMTGIPTLACDLAQLCLPNSPHKLELIAFHIAGVAGGAPPASHVAFRVADISAALEAIRALGAEQIGEVTVFPEGRAVYCREPGGSVFELSTAGA